MNNSPQQSSLGDQLLLAALFALAGFGLLIFFVLFAQPPPRLHRAAYQGNYSEQALLDQLTATNLNALIAQIKDLSVRPGERQEGRASGSPGGYRTEELIESEFKADGLKVQTQELEVVVPETEFCEVLGADGQPLPGVTLYPYEPAGMVPIVLPPEGIKAQLVAVEKTDLTLLNGHDPRDTILLTYLNGVDDWGTPASVGVRALIAREDNAAKNLRTDSDAAAPWGSLYQGTETYFPRFIARGPIEKFAGQQVTIRCKVTWQTKKVRNVLGVLPGKGAGREALVVTAFYDSSSIIPELAPGAEQSLSLTALLEYARALAPYRGQLERDIVFVATAGHAQAMAGVARLMEAIETFSRTRPGYRTFEEQRADQVRQLGYAKQALQICEEWKQGKTRTPAEFKAAWLNDAGFRAWFEDACITVAGEINLERHEDVLAAKLAYIRSGRPVYREGFNAAAATDEERIKPENSSPLLTAYIAAQTDDNTAANLMGLPIEELATRPEFVKWYYATLAEKLFQERQAYHQGQIAQFDDSIAVRNIFSAYDRTLTLNLDLYSGGKQGKNNLAVMVGVKNPGTVVEPQVSDLRNAILNNVPNVGGDPQFNVIHWGSRDALGNWENPSPVSSETAELESVLWHRCGRMAFSAVTAEFFPPKACTPEDTWDNLSTDVLQQQIPVLGRTILALGSGQVTFKRILPDSSNYAQVFTIHGTVLASAGASSVVPTHRMTVRTFVRAYNNGWVNNDRIGLRGIQEYPILQANPYGDFRREFASDFGGWSGPAVAIAVRFDAAGAVTYINDTSAKSQALFNSTSLPVSDIIATGPLAAKPINLSMFRCTPVAFFDMINPQTMKAFKDTAYLDSLGLSAPAQYNFRPETAFLEPDLKFFVGLLDGAADNKELLTDRAFMLNVDTRQPITPGEPDIFGRGYLAADTSLLAMPDLDAAASMLRTSEKRLRLQERFGMADEQMIGFHKQGEEWLEEAQKQVLNKDTANAMNAAGASLAYAINNYPVIRSRISQAVVGILWYLGLLVPFVFFTEKLICGYADIRKQLLASGVIFLVVFTLLRLFHPAFEMVRSSVMILLGFVILLLTFLVTLMVGGKFKQNIKELRRAEGRVEGADISRGGVAGTAFMLGLNNMRRRKVRTGLTCATLVLITFVMICFTSVSTDLVNVEQPTGRSSWNGLMIRDPNFRALDPAQISNIRQIYGTRYPITVHSWLVASAAAGQNTEILIDRDLTMDGSKFVKRSRVNAAVQMDWSEPSFSGIDHYLLTKKGWFPRPPATRAERDEAIRKGYKTKNLVILPDSIAAELGIRPEDVDNDTPKVNIRGVEYEVQGIIDSAELAKCQGLDGQSILPYDINSIQSLGADATGGVILPPDIGRLLASQVILVNVLPPGKGGADQAITTSCMVLFPKAPYRIKADQPVAFRPLDYKTQRREVLGYLERTGQPAYYAIDGVSYNGWRQRATSFAGLLELLVPILIAALTVFNTMRGSVYERKGEIYVYNAVGIAPNHVFFMFMAEACVYAVIGAVLGYILSQGTGRLLTYLHFTGGMNMDYSSIETIYASLAIMVSVLLSTIIPARDAAKLAAPSDIVSWTVPKAEGDVMTFNLPFTFTPHDRVAVVSYFRRWLDANGAGSSGPFFCSPPEVHLSVRPGGSSGTDELVLLVASTVWLKPYDLGVSQRMEISLPTDSETGEFIARITLTRLSGHLAGWNRTLRPFLGVLRKQFLNWRATTDAERQEMFKEANGLLNECAAKEETYA